MMDAVTFVRETKRMCESFDDCCSCPLEKRCVSFPPHLTDPEEYVSVIEKWAEENPEVGE